MGILFILIDAKSTQNYFPLGGLALLVIVVVFFVGVVQPLVEFWIRGVKVRHAVRDFNFKSERLKSAIGSCYRELEEFAKEMPEQALSRLYNIVFAMEIRLGSSKRGIDMYRCAKFGNPFWSGPDRALEALTVCESAVKTVDELFAQEYVLSDEITKLRNFKTEIPESLHQLGQWLERLDGRRLSPITDRWALLVFNLARAGKQQAEILLKGKDVPGGVDYLQVHAVLEGVFKNINSTQGKFIKALQRQVSVEHSTAGPSDQGKR